MEYLKKLFVEAKLAVGILVFGVASLTGGYTFLTEYFVTTVYAANLESQIKSTIKALDLNTKSNTRMITEMRLIRLETKKQQNIPLTPTEAIVYEKLKNQYMNDIHREMRP